MSQKLILTITIMILEFSLRRVFEFTDFKSPVENANLCRESTKIGFYALKWTKLIWQRTGFLLFSVVFSLEGIVIDHIYGVWQAVSLHF